jgi:uncharacterized protein (TIGR03435 family)
MNLLRSPIGVSFAAVFLACAALPAQTPAAHFEFEVASIKPSAPAGTRGVNIGVHLDGARIGCTSLSLKDYLRIAYRVRDYQISGPEWLDSERFDIAATLPEGGRDKVPEMLQALLADRFHLVLHRDKKEFSVYGLVVGKGGPKMKESAVDPDAPAAGPGSGEPGKGAVNVSGGGGRGGVMLNLGDGSFFGFADNKLEAKKLTMVRFADTVSRFTDLPVVDMTDLKASYDFQLEFTPEDYRGMMIRSALSAGVSLPPEVVKRALEGAGGDSLFTAVQTLGLKLERRRAPLEVLVVDKADKSPTGN